MTWYFYGKHERNCANSFSLSYIKEEEFSINTVFLLVLASKSFFARIFLAHGFNHVVDAADFREIVPSRIGRTFRDVERLDDSVVNVHAETLGSPRAELGARSWVRQFDAQVFNHNGVRVTHERNVRARDTLCLSPRVHDSRVVGTENDHLIDPSSLQFVLSGNKTRNLTRGSCRCESTWKADQEDLFAFASFSHVDWCWHAIDPRTELQYATDLISNFSTHCARR